MFVHSAVILLVLLPVVAFSASLPLTTSFGEYAGAFARTYGAPGSAEYVMRRGLFETRSARVREHNSREGRLWTAGLNHLTDRTDDELAGLRGWRRSGGAQRGSVGDVSFLTKGSWRTKTIAAEVDWRNLTVNKAVKDQGNCGSCWAVATASMLQAHDEIRTGVARQLSAQQLVDCVPNVKECGGSGGCQGATVELAMEWITENGLDDAATVKYTAEDGTCTVTPSFVERSLRGTGVVARHGGADTLGLVGWETLPSNKAKPLMHALMNGPVAISAGATDWFLYDTGIFDSCSKDAIIDHAIVLVGFGTDNTKKYWTVQNSWGSSWGENGYIRLLRHDSPDEDDAFCGTDSRPEDGVACKPYPAQVEVCGMCGILYDSVAPHYAAKH